MNLLVCSCPWDTKVWVNTMVGLGGVGRGCSDTQIGTPAGARYGPNVTRQCRCRTYCYGQTMCMPVWDPHAGLPSVSLQAPLCPGCLYQARMGLGRDHYLGWAKCYHPVATLPACTCSCDQSRLSVHLSKHF